MQLISLGLVCVVEYILLYTIRNTVSNKMRLCFASLIVPLFSLSEQSTLNVDTPISLIKGIWV